MTTTLYISSIAAWFAITIYLGADQMNSCASDKNRIERDLDVTAVCVTSTSEMIIVDGKAYIAHVKGN